MKEWQYVMSILQLHFHKPIYSQEHYNYIHVRKVDYKFCSPKKLRSSLYPTFVFFWSPSVNLVVNSKLNFVVNFEVGSNTNFVVLLVYYEVNSNPNLSLVINTNPNSVVLSANFVIHAQLLLSLTVVVFSSLSVDFVFNLS
ncbi:uncharacterized protein LACBIDRAFT_335584 [Laccaria bicolor S238N-H82]|uniref:Predicted protein n=1 Tax=Laccaria bicolor (strain S238N-H82 / ATCC MYA-4686) TaxID=486041 RepID=B0E2R2_LACBS|nr:uncharacterized protein LACBIDRAFT_335584 [Laccaria bicolor S238N-H82]EDQ98866.1 predicted protein [Laccaria bicolor S238N-H82]|eukprot:XP_001890476.1 predicted protein [Laccaria bicolor S238N-H82]